jgi:hypothetical protein
MEDGPKVSVGSPLVTWFARTEQGCYTYWEHPLENATRMKQLFETCFATLSATASEIKRHAIAKNRTQWKTPEAPELQQPCNAAATKCLPE